MNNAAVISRCELNRQEPTALPERILRSDWYTFSHWNLAFDFADDNLEVFIRISEDGDGLHAYPLKYCYDDGSGAREYDSNSFDPPFAWRVIERLSGKFTKDNIYHMLADQAA